MFYFSFSHSVNHLMCTSEKARRRGTEVVRSVPSDRLLVESDVHASIDVTLGTAGAVAYAAHVRGERIEDVAERVARDLRRQTLHVELQLKAILTTPCHLLGARWLTLNSLGTVALQSIQMA